MKDPASLIEIKEFLKIHTPIDRGAKFEAGACVDKWKVVAFLGKGGCGEVYRVQNAETGDFAALKISRSAEALANKRIEREAGFLEKNDYPFFPRFFERGAYDGFSYFVMEELRPIDLPDTDKGVADLMIMIGEAVSLLHSYGFVHRDIKPANIMERISKGNRKEYVLIDLGLLKWHNASYLGAEKFTVTVVDGKAATSGTRRYSAPEQFYGEELTPAADIHALGVIVHDCFSGSLPHIWEKIFLRATSTLADCRYQNVQEFVRAVRRRKLNRGVAAFACAIVGLLGCAIVMKGVWTLNGVTDGDESLPIISYNEALGVEGYRWRTSADSWVICSGESFDGGYAVQSSGGGAGIAETFIETTVSGKAKEMTVKFQLFYYKGKFSIELDDKSLFLDKSISRDPEDAWRIVKVKIPDGEHKLKFKYRHSGTGFINKFNGVTVDTIKFVDDDEFTPRES